MGRSRDLEKGMRAIYQQNKKLRGVLLSTKDTYILDPIHDSNDTNVYGLLLMKIRGEIVGRVPLGGEPPITPLGGKPPITPWGASPP